MIESFEQWSASFVPGGVYVCAKPVEDHAHCLTNAEAEAVASAVSKRRNAYSTGRACAKTALQKLSVAKADFADGLLRQDDGAVNWPNGIVGSISHTDEWAIAAVAKKQASLVSIGIDIEKIDRVGSNTLKTIATEQERHDIESDASTRWLRVALFSVKESLYKCLRPVYGEFIRFKDVQVTQMTRALVLKEESATSSSKVEIFNPQIELLLPKLSGCCVEANIDLRLAVMPSHVLSFVSYRDS